MMRKHTAAAASARLPAHLLWLALLYCVASLTHFAHNAEYIAFYPNMPAWLTREQVYVVWMGISLIGVAAFVLYFFGWPIASAGLLAIYGSFGFDALGHYALALCSQHTLVQNLTIWFEAAAGAALLSSCIWYLMSHRRHAVR